MSVAKWSETANYEYHKQYTHNKPIFCGCWDHTTNTECKTIFMTNMLVYVCFDMNPEEDTICLECASKLFDVTIDELLQEYK